jgi:hypothetical protein
MKKQETLEEYAEKYAHNYFNMHETNNYKALKQGFIEGAKYQAERMYSEEEMQSAWEDGRNGETECIGSYPFYKTVFKNKTFKEWFQQFKKK